MSCCTKKTVAQVVFHSATLIVAGITPLVTSLLIARHKINNFSERYPDISGGFSSGGGYSGGREGWIQFTTTLFSALGFTVVGSSAEIMAAVLILTTIRINRCFETQDTDTEDTQLYFDESKSGCNVIKKILPDTKAMLELGLAFFSALVVGSSVISLLAFGLTPAVTTDLFHNTNDTEAQLLGELSNDMSSTIAWVGYTLTVASAVLIPLFALMLDSCYKCCRQPQAHTAINSSDEEFDEFSL